MYLLKTWFRRIGGKIRNYLNNGEILFINNKPPFIGDDRESYIFTYVIFTN